MVQEIGMKKFAEIDQDMLKTDTITDTHKVLSRIKTNEDYQSFQ